MMTNFRLFILLLISLLVACGTSTDTNKTDASIPRFTNGDATASVDTSVPTKRTCKTSVDCADDDPYCTLEVCVNGVCENPPRTCNDNNVCTTDFCDPASGCKHPAVKSGTVCDDGDNATVETCQSGKCVVKTKPACTTNSDCPVLDDKPCFMHMCDVNLGKCVTVVDDTDVCDDKNKCTENDACVSGKCIGTPANCDDKNPCTTDSCHSLFGCEHKIVVCTGLMAQCLEKPTGVVTVAGVCADCTEHSQCDDGSKCTVDSCDPLTGKCKHTPDPCTDNNKCTVDSCNTADKGDCEHKLLACDDGNFCTDDACSFSTGTCVNKLVANVTKLCDDKDACTIDACDMDLGKCVSTPKTDCTDNNQCTDDSCPGPGGCMFMPNSAPCDDNDACTKGDFCADGYCSDYVDWTWCFDGNPCTNEQCDSTTGNCIFPAKSCMSDGNPCTNDYCDSTKGCVYVAKVCSDGDPCTDDACNTQTGTCTFAQKAGCNLPGCMSDTDCNDNKPCTLDKCDPKAKVCVNADLAGACPAGLTCTGIDAFSKVQCKKLCQTNAECATGNPCTDQVCVQGSCQMSNTDNLGCSDGNPCTLNDKCLNSACQAGAAKGCNDNDPCTADSCSGTNGQCLNVPQSQGTCDDAKADTFNDVCQNGVCKGTPKIPCAKTEDCSDSNPCTSNVCDPVKGCLFVVDIATCSDNNVCNGSEVCQNGVCQAGTPQSCDDANQCTADSCHPVTGCANVDLPVGATCSDGNQCTTGDNCQGKTCVAGSTPKSCNDNDDCTADSCNPTSGCVNAPIAGCQPKNLCLRWSNPSAASNISLEIAGCIGAYNTVTKSFSCDGGWSKLAVKTDMPATDTFIWCAAVPVGKALIVNLGFDPCISSSLLGYCAKNSPAGDGNNTNTKVDLLGKHEVRYSPADPFTLVTLTQDPTQPAFVLPNGAGGGNLIIHGK